VPAKEKNPALKRFGTNVRALREKRELSQEQLAEIADLDRTYVGGLERGERNATLGSALRIAKALKTTVAALCEGIDR
jgi:transcriptional regulator with XRE-family HTH domain